MEFKRHNERWLQHLTVMPFIYAMIIPIIFLDLSMEIYHQICFPLCKIPKLNRRNYISLDRIKLSYLNPWEKINCAYCGYANGLFNYASAIASASEKYWCGIMHEKKEKFLLQKHQKDYLPFGDEKAYRNFLEKVTKK